MTNENFFSSWSAEMAYVLGYFCADGCMFVNRRGSRYVAFHSADYELIPKIKMLLGSRHKIGVRKRTGNNWRNLYSLQIGSKKMFFDLNKLGICPAKAKRLLLPDVPDRFLGHFVRGYFDGDGCISYGFYKRKDRKNRMTFVCMVRFASSSKEFLSDLSQRLVSALKTKAGSIVKNTSGFHLVYPKNSCSKLFNFMYNKVSRNLFLTRKYKKFQQALNSFGAVA